MSGIIRDSLSLEAFFFERMEEAQERREADLPDDVEAYLVHLLAGFARRPGQAGRTAPALALQYLAARDRGALALREVGDRAMFVAGVVPGSLERSAVDLRYVTGLGSSAYREVNTRAPNLDVFGRLAESFTDLAKLLTEAVRPDDGDEPQGLLAVYERWRRTGGTRERRRLIAAGVRLEDSVDIEH